MCAGEEFCGSCKPGEEILEFASGHAHVMPVFGDANQMFTAQLKRRKRFLELLRQLNPEISAWPEFSQRLGFERHVQLVSRRCKIFVNSRKLQPMSLHDDISQAIASFQASAKKKTRAKLVKVIAKTKKRWARKHLAEAEMLAFGKLVYAQAPADTSQPFQKLPFNQALCQIRIAA